MNKVLPTLTQIGDHRGKFPDQLLALIVLFIAGYFLRQQIRTSAGRKTFDTIKLNLPLFSACSVDFLHARFTYWTNVAFGRVSRCSI